ncbi:MAG: tyrosine-type recombinase/integrase, partial [Candidatus Limnocylindria bacterium]
MAETITTPGLVPGARRALDSFLDGLRGRNASPGTVTEYRRHATEFLVFVNERGVDWRSPDRTTVRHYLSMLADRDLAATSVAGRLAAVRSLYRHALRHGRIETDPLAGVRAPRRPSRLPRVLSVDEAEELVTAPRRMSSRDEALARRDEAMLELLYATGMRISELAGLTIDRVDLRRRRLRVIGKGTKERELLFGAPAARALRGYLEHARPVLAARGGGGAAVFLNASGTGLTARGAR